ncbi:MAG: glycosyltransferase 87 family protein [Chloroflexota bacterium]
MTAETRSSMIASVLVIGMILALFVTLVINPIYGADFYFVFLPIAEDLWLGNATLYVDTNGYFNPAHAMLYWMLLALPPVSVANAIHFIGTLILLFAIVYLWQTYTERSIFYAFFALLGLYTIDHLIRGQMDVIAVFGVVLAFWATREEKPYLLGLGATLAVIKPTSLVLPLLLIAWHIRTWSFADIGKASLIPILSIVATIAIFGFEWIPNLLNLVATGSPVDGLSALSIYDMASVIKLPSLIPGVISIIFAIGVLAKPNLSAERFAFALVANVLASTYVAGYHFVVLIPAILCIRHKWMVIIAWLLSLLPLLRLVSTDTFDLEYLILLLPVYVASVLLWQMMRETSPESDNP